MMPSVDALVIGAGPAGSAVAILLARAGWRVTLVEQQAYPRQKVCGECISAGSLTLLDELGVGPRFRELAGPELHRVGWIGKSGMVTADFPACTVGAYRYGRAMGRDVLDELLVERARAVGVEVLQPAKVCRVRGGPGEFDCEIRMLGHRQRLPGNGSARMGSAWKGPSESGGGWVGAPWGDSDGRQTVSARVVIDAHGSWEAGPDFIADPPPSERRAGSASGADAGFGRSAGGIEVVAAAPTLRAPKHDGDLFAFKASFGHSGLAPGLLPVVSFPGGYGGAVVADGGRTTLACCIRRDVLRSARASQPGATAGEAVAAWLASACRGLAEVIDPGARDGAWLSVGPIRPGVRVHGDRGRFRVGNAAGETHPLIGEGISMALQSAFLLVAHLGTRSAAGIDLAGGDAVNRRYAAAWDSAFAHRLVFARAYAHAAMRPSVSGPLFALLRHWPVLLTQAAQWAGKAQRPLQAGAPRSAS